MTKVDKKFNDFKIAKIVELREEIKQELSEAVEKEIYKKKEPEPTACMLQEHAKNYRKQVNVLKCSQGEIEQYGRRLHIRIDAVPMAENETSNNVLQNIRSIIEESSSEILTLQSTWPIRLVKDTLIKQLG